MTKANAATWRRRLGTKQIPPSRQEAKQQGFVTAQQRPWALVAEEAESIYVKA